VYLKNKTARIELKTGFTGWKFLPRKQRNSPLGNVLKWNWKLERTLFKRILMLLCRVLLVSTSLTILLMNCCNLNLCFFCNLNFIETIKLYLKLYWQKLNQNKVNLSSWDIGMITRFCCSKLIPFCCKRLFFRVQKRERLTKKGKSNHILQCCALCCCTRWQSFLFIYLFLTTFWHQNIN